MNYLRRYRRRLLLLLLLLVIVIWALDRIRLRQELEETLCREFNCRVVLTRFVEDDSRIRDTSSFSAFWRPFRRSTGRIRGFLGIFWNDALRFGSMRLYSRVPVSERRAISQLPADSTMPFLELFNLTADPYQRKILTSYVPFFKERYFDFAFVSEVTVERAVVHLIYDTYGWNTTGLLPGEAAEVPAVERIVCKRLELIVSTPWGSYADSGSGTLILRRKGDFDLEVGGLVFADTVRVQLRGSGTPEPRYALELIGGRVPAGRPVDLRLEMPTNLVPLVQKLFAESGPKDFRSDTFALQAEVAGETACVTGVVAGEKNRIEARAAWNSARGNGKLTVSYDRQYREFRGELENAIPLPVSLIPNSPFIAGTFAVRHARWQGPFTGPWQFDPVEITWQKVAMERPVIMKDGAGECRLAGRWSLGEWPPRHLKLSGRVEFREIRNDRWLVEDGDLRVAGDPGRIRLDGQARFLGGEVRAEELRVECDPHLQWQTVEGRLRFEEIDPSFLDLAAADCRLKEANGTLDLSARNREGEVEIKDVRFAAERLTGEWRDEPFTLTAGQGRYSPRAAGADWTLSGRLQALEGTGQIELEFAEDKLRRAALKQGRGIKSERLRRVLKSFNAGADAERALERVENLDLEVAARLDGEQWEVNGSAASADFTLPPPPSGEADRRRHALQLRVVGRFPAPGGDGALLVREASVSLDRKIRLRLASPLTWQEGAQPPKGAIEIDCLDIPLARELAFTYAGDRLPAGAWRNIPLAGALTGGRISHGLEGAGYKVEAVTGALKLDGAPLVFRLDGEVQIRDSAIGRIAGALAVSRFSPQALLSTVADIDTRVDGGIVRMQGEAAATLKFAGDSLNDIRVDGLLEPHGVNIKFRDYPVQLDGFRGAIPFVLARSGTHLGKLRPMSLEITEAQRIHFERVSYLKLTATDFTALARLDTNILQLDQVKYRFAGGQGEGAVAFVFEPASQVRVALMTRIHGFEAAEVFDRMLPYNGSFAGTADLDGVTIKFGELNPRANEEGSVTFKYLNELEAVLRFRKGMIGGEPFQEFVVKNLSDTAPVNRRANGIPNPSATIIQISGGSSNAGNVLQQTIGRMTEWDFNSAEIRISLDPTYYDRVTAYGKFGSDDVKAELVGNYAICGPVRPLEHFRIFNEIQFLPDLPIIFTLKVENMPLRLSFDRIGRRMTGKTELFTFGDTEAFASDSAGAAADFDTGEAALEEETGPLEPAEVAGE